MTEKTINEVFRNRTGTFGDRIAIEKKRSGKWEKATWNEYYEESRAAGLGLHALGLTKGDRVSLLSDNRLEWLFTDMGALGAGLCVVPIYSTLTEEEICHILKNSESRVAVVENRAQLQKVLNVQGRCPSLEKIAVIESEGRGDRPRSVMSFAELLRMGRDRHESDDSLFERLARSVAPEDLATIVYTSGTTGVPKGAMITHGNIMAVVKSLDSVRPRYAHDTDQTVPFLPLSHVFERVAGHFYGMYVGITASYAQDINTIVEDIREKAPTIILAVPRVCEKIYQNIMMQVQRQPRWRQRVFFWGHEIGTRICRIKEEKRPVPLLMNLRYKLAYHLIFKKLKEALGGRVRWITASGAPTSPDIIRFFNAAGIMVIEGYGMTECTAPATMSNLADYRIGTVGKPLPGVEIRLARDGEILIKGDNVFRGYWKMEDATSKAFTSDGYLLTGDIGEFTEDGFLKIVDRKKDLIITSGGKNVAPQKIENLFKSDSLFSQVIVTGEKRKYLTALMNINLEHAAAMAREEEISFDSPGDLLENGEFLNMVDRRVADLNARLAKYETIKRYTLIKQEFSKESGELTATLKVKRKVVREKYGDVIDSMYDDESMGSGLN